MYKFFGQPFKEVTSKKTNKIMFRFDTKGEFITDDEEIIRRAKGYFDCIELKAEVIGTLEKRIVSDPVLIITTKDDEKELAKENTEEELRELAKEKGITSWHVKSVDTLKKELEV